MPRGTNTDSARRDNDVDINTMMMISDPNNPRNDEMWSNTEYAKTVCVEYLGPAYVIHGRLWGQPEYYYINLVVRAADYTMPARNVVFIVVTGSNKTRLSAEVMKALLPADQPVPQELDVCFQNRRDLRITAKLSDCAIPSSRGDNNILGTDFLNRCCESSQFGRGAVTLTLRAESRIIESSPQ
ncbi:hypothetical protein MP228_006104 [Amoeboaphelidium protococcarum]|nr:hypothetical protein MP228_006104 [Amoeboaphelidium protococcarum]